MARRRVYGTDNTFAEWHRVRLAEEYQRTGHRLDMADRDWTEFCHWCKEPLLTFEEVLDKGQDLRDKAVTVTRRLAERADIPAWLVAVRLARPPEVQREIDRLYKQIRELEDRYPISYFTVRRIWPKPEAKFHRLTPSEMAAEFFLVHRDHHQNCPKVPENYSVHAERITKARNASPLWVPRLLRLFGRDGGQETTEAS